MTTVDTPARATRREWLGLVLLCLPTMLTTVDINITFLALPHLAADLESTGTQQLWITDIYGFTIAGFLITMGTLGDRIGRRRLLLIGAAAFIGASVLAAYASSTAILIVARALIGVCGATVMPTVLALIRVMFRDPRQMSLAMAAWGTSLSAGVVLGSVIGGLLLGAFWWGSIFLLAVPIMALVLLVGPVLLPEWRNPEPGRLDLLSVSLSLAGVLPLIFGLKELATHGWRPLPIVAVFVGAAFGWLFVRRQQRLATPLLDLSLFRNHVLSAALLLAMGVAFTSAGIGLMATVYMQMVKGFEPIEVGLLLLGPALGTVVMGNLTPFIARKVRPAVVLAAGMLVGAAGMVILTQLSATAGVALLLVGLVIAYLGNGPIGTFIPFMIMSSTPREKAGSVASLPGTVGEFGAALGVALLGLVGTSVYRNQVDVPAALPGDAADAAHESVAGAVSVAGHVGGPAGAELLGAARDAFTTGLNAVAVVAAVVFAGLAVLAAVVLRHIPPIGGMPDGGDGAAQDAAAGPAGPAAEAAGPAAEAAGPAADEAGQRIQAG
jgi:MFS transporter, DHA2 family, multidrug resistance protein